MDSATKNALNNNNLTKGRKSKRKRRSTMAKETNQQRRERLAKMQEYNSKRMEQETAEEREARLRRSRDYMRQRKECETEEDRDERRKYMRKYLQRKLKNESTEDRELRLNKNRDNQCRHQSKSKNIDKCKEYRKEYYRKTVENQTPEERQRRLERVSEYNRTWKEKNPESDEQRQKRLERQREYNQRYKERHMQESNTGDTKTRRKRRSLNSSDEPKPETEEHRQLRLKKFREYLKKRRESETEEQRQLRLSKIKEYNQKRMQNETPEQREQRLIRIREYQKRRSENGETEEERLERLNKVKEYNKNRRMNETPEQRQQRLHKLQEYFRKKRENDPKPTRRGRPTKHYSVEIMREYYRQVAKLKRESETEEERQARLMQIKEYNRMRRKQENLDQREKRLCKMQEYFQKKRDTESEEARQRRLQRTKEYNNLYLQRKKDERERRLQKLKEYNHKRKELKLKETISVIKPDKKEKSLQNQTTATTTTDPSNQRHSYGTRASKKTIKKVPPSPELKYDELKPPPLMPNFIPQITLTPEVNVAFSDVLFNVLKHSQSNNPQSNLLFIESFIPRSKACSATNQCNFINRSLCSRSNKIQNCILANVIRHKYFLSKGQTETLRYRYLAKCGGYSWIVTQATLVYDKQKPQSVVCVNYVISGIENENDIYTCAQLEARQKSEKPIELNKELNESDKDIITEIKREKPAPPAADKRKTTIVNRNCAPAVNNLKTITTKLLPPIKDNKPRSVTASVFSSVADIIPSKFPIQTRAQSVTASVFTPLATLNGRSQSTTAKLFAPRTEDMNRSLLMFLDEGNDSTANMLKEEQDDLANLAPTAGDECIPLDVSAPLFGEMFDGFILPDGYGTLLPDDIGQFDAQNHKANVDPFMSYRDDSNDTIGTPNVLSPRDSSKSPNSSSLPSLCSPNSLSHDDEFTFMTMNCEDDIDLTMRAPYIPMNENDDLPLLTEDLMWSAFSDELSLHKDIREALQNEQFKDSSLAAALLSANNNLSQMNPNGEQIDLKKSSRTTDPNAGGNGMVPSEEIMKQVYNKRRRHDETARHSSTVQFTKISGIDNG